MLTPGQAHRSTTCLRTTLHLCILLEFHIFSRTRELNISSTCIIMKLNMKSMVVHKGW